MADPNMELAYHFAQALGPAPSLPLPLTDLAKMTEMLLRIDGKLSQDPYLVREDGLWVHISQILVVAGQIRHLAEDTKEYMPDLDPLQRVNLALRLWAGCLDAAKIVSDVTNSGKNDAKQRRALIPILVARAECPIYKAGIPAGPRVRRTRRQPVIYEGIEEYRDSLFRDPSA